MAQKENMPVDNHQDGYFSESVYRDLHAESNDHNTDANSFIKNHHTSSNHSYLNGCDDYFTDHITNPEI